MKVTSRYPVLLTVCAYIDCGMEGGNDGLTVKEPPIVALVRLGNIVKTLANDRLFDLRVGQEFGMLRPTFSCSTSEFAPDETRGQIDLVLKVFGKRITRPIRSALRKEETVFIQFTKGIGLEVVVFVSGDQLTNIPGNLLDGALISLPRDIVSSFLKEELRPKCQEISKTENKRGFLGNTTLFRVEINPFPTIEFDKGKLQFRSQAYNPRFQNSSFVAFLSKSINQFAEAEGERRQKLWDEPSDILFS